MTYCGNYCACKSCCDEEIYTLTVCRYFGSLAGHLTLKFRVSYCNTSQEASIRGSTRSAVTQALPPHSTRSAVPLLLALLAVLAATDLSTRLPPPRLTSNSSSTSNNNSSVAEVSPISAHLRPSRLPRRCHSSSWCRPPLSPHP